MPEELDNPPYSHLRLRWALRWVRIGLADLPAATPLLLRMTDGGPGRKITAETDLLLEGYPRSGNSFSAEAIKRSQPEPLRVSSHMHAPAQVLTAVRLGVPVLIVVREPVKAAASLMVTAPYMSARQALFEWVRFHKRVLTVADKVVVATFPQVTADMGAVTARVNQRFGRQLVEFEHTPEHVAATFAHIDSWNVERFGQLSEREAGRPSEARAEARRKTDAALAAPGLERLRTRAAALYNEFEQLAER